MRNRAVLTRRSVLVRTRPMALAIRLYTTKNTRAWKKIAIWFVFLFMKESFSPLVVKRTPGLNVKKSAAGIATRWAVRLGGSILI